MSLCTEQADRNVHANTTTVWLAFLLAGMKVNGCNALLEVAANCVGFPILSVRAIVIAMQALNLYCSNALHLRCNESQLAFQQHAAID